MLGARLMNMSKVILTEKSETKARFANRRYVLAMSVRLSTLYLVVKKKETSKVDEPGRNNERENRKAIVRKDIPDRFINMTDASSFFSSFEVKRIASDDTMSLNY